MTSASTEGKTTEQFEKDMIFGVNNASELAKLTDKLAKVSAANVRLLYQLRERNAKEAARARKQRKYRFFVSYVALLVGAVATILGVSHVIPLIATVAVDSSCVSLCLYCLAFEILASKK